MKMPQMLPVSSSNVLEIGYSSEDQSVFVRFTDNSLYRYNGVPPHEFEGLQRAGSIGSYIHRNFKNVYAYERIE